MLVYLDSQHVSRIASGEIIYNGLFGSAYEHVKFVFSFAHYVEAFPKHEKEYSYAEERIEIIDNIPNKTFVIPLFDVFNVEFDARSAIIIDQLLCGESDILPGSRGCLANFNIRNEMRAALNSFLLGIPDVNLRRSFRAKVFRHGKIQHEFLKSFSMIDASDEDTRRIIRDSGLSDFIEGRSDANAFTRRFEVWLSVPKNFISLTRTKFPMFKPISDMFWNQNEIIANLVLKLVEQTEKTLPEAQEAKFVIESVCNEDFIELQIDSFATKVFGGSIRGVAHMKSFRLFAKSIISFVFKKLMDSTRSGNFQKPKIRKSDFGDLIHLGYKPYVDIFCCDRRTRELLLSMGESVANVCVTDEELKRAIASH